MDSQNTNLAVDSQHVALIAQLRTEIDSGLQTIASLKDENSKQQTELVIHPTAQAAAARLTAVAGDAR